LNQVPVSYHVATFHGFYSANNKTRCHNRIEIPCMEIKRKYGQEIDRNCAFDNTMSKYGKNGKIRICHVTEKAFGVREVLLE